MHFRANIEDAPATHRYSTTAAVFLKRGTSGWAVAMPLFAIEFKLAVTPPSGAMGDLSEATIDKKYEALAQELETAALLIPTPEPGLTGEATTYFPAIFDLLGGCAEPERAFRPECFIREDDRRGDGNLCAKRHVACLVSGHGGRNS